LEVIMFKKVLASSLLVAGLAAASMSSTPAVAKDGRNGAFAAGAAAGLVGGAIVGNAVRPSYGRAPAYAEPDCYWRRERVYDPDFDEYRVRRVRVCD
jgi:hypothetical protein